MVDANDSYYLENLLDPKKWFRVAGGLIANSKELEPKVFKFWSGLDESQEAEK